MNRAAEKKQTIETYNRSAKEHAEKFNQIGVRINDIQRVFSYIKKPNPKVIELGCGNGRDAKEIIKLTNDYLGIDLSENILQLAKQNVPDAQFQLSDIESYQIPPGVDIIFAFASMLHSNRNNVKKILHRAYDSLNPSGVFFISSKHGLYHKETINKGGHGLKTYYFYTPKEINNLTPPGFRNVYQDIQDFKGQTWFSIILQKEQFD